MSTSPATTERRRRPPRRPRRSVRSTTLRATAVSLVAALGISGALAAQMAAGNDPALGKKAKQAHVRRAPSAPAPPPVVTRSS